MDQDEFVKAYLACLQQNLAFRGYEAEQLIAADPGMQIYLPTDCLISKSVSDIPFYPYEAMDQLPKYLSSDID